MTSSKNTLVFTDFDGTLIDHETYSWKAAEEAIRRLKAEKIPIVPCTSKTRAEIEYYRRGMGLGDPFISENGGAIFIPGGYFDFGYEFDRESGGYNIIELGMPYHKLRGVLDEMRSFGEIVGFGDMTVAELAGDAGLSLEEARMAKDREYDEAFRFRGDEEGLKREIGKMGLNWTKGGRYWHIMGDNDKGKAVRILSGIYQKKYRGMKTIGIGDSLNDLPMLKEVDIPVLVQKKGGGYDQSVEIDGLIRAQRPGPEGWNEEILRLLE